MSRQDLARNKINQAKAIALTPRQQVFRDAVSLQDKNDLFRVRASGNSRVQLNLRGLRGNADLQIFKPRQSLQDTRRRIGRADFSRLSGARIRRALTLVGQSRRGGRSNEAITANLAPGTYFIRVFHRGRASTPYRLIAKATSTQAPPPAQTRTQLYNGSGLPTQQNNLVLGQVPIPTADIPANLRPFIPFLPDEAQELITPTPFATQTPTTNGVVLDTRNRAAANPNVGYAGYSNYEVDFSNISLSNPTDFTFSPVNPNFPTLDNAEGYSLTFNLAINAESSVADRAGFSLLVVGSDRRAIELDFKSNQIFAQAVAFGKAERVTPTFNLAARNNYRLNVANGRYSLFANGAQILTGAMRRYAFDPNTSDPPLPANPYATPNFIFAGDLTDGGSSRTTLGPVSLFT